jgi:hypothetical protein
VLLTNLILSTVGLKSNPKDVPDKCWCQTVPIAVNAPLAVFTVNNLLWLETAYKLPFAGLKSIPTIVSFVTKPVNATELFVPLVG